MFRQSSRVTSSVMLTVAFLIVTFLFGCSNSAGRESQTTVPAAPSVNNSTPAATPAMPAAGTPVGAKAQEMRKIIETSQVTLETNDLSVVEKLALQALDKRQGKIDASNVSLDNTGRRTGNYTLRIPAGQLQDYTAELAAIPDVIVRQKNISAQDVTEEFIDINARLENMQRQELRLREILAKANTVDEILKVEKELANVRGQIESVTGRLKAMTGRIDMSTVQLRISEVSLLAESNYWGKLRGIIRDSWVGAGDVLLYLIATVIVLSPIAILAAVIFWLWRKRQKNRKGQQPLLPPEKSNER